MKILRYSADGATSYGILEEDGTIHPLSSTPFDSLDASGPDTHLDQVRTLVPLESPRVIGVGLNYAAHAREGGHEPPSFPMLFMKPSTAVIGPEEPIVYPRQAQNLQHECELAVVMGQTTPRHVATAQALDYVLGYTCGNDISERVIQRAEMDMGCLLIGKGFDTFCPLGPCIATGLDPTNLDIFTRVNGAEKQNSNTSDLLFPVARLIAYISEALTLLPGDVILTGTPSGVSSVVPGDVIEIEVAGIGVLRNPVVAEA